MWLIIRNCFPRAEVVQPLVFVCVQIVKANNTAITSFDSQDQDNAQANKPLEVRSASAKCATVHCVTDSCRPSGGVWQHRLAKQVNLLCGANAGFLNVLPGGVYSILLAWNGLKSNGR